MGQPRTPKPVKLVMSLIIVSEALWPVVIQDLRRCYGETDFVGPWLAFDFTDYYTPEMGRDLKRRFVAFRGLVDPDTLPTVKLQTNRIEQRYAKKAMRQVNIDPGYVCGEHLILVSTKAYSHRPYLREGIYADLTLIYRRGSYRPLAWTYPDYRQPGLIEMFNGIRKAYLSQLREAPHGVPQTQIGETGCGEHDRVWKRGRG
jgi:hypothetical protein